MMMIQVKMQELLDASSAALNSMAISMGTQRHALETDFELRVRIGRLLGYDVAKRYIPAPGDLFTLTDGASHRSEVFRCLHGGQQYVFACSLLDYEESLINIKSCFEKVDENGRHHRRAMIEALLTDASEGELIENLSEKMEHLLGDWIDQAIDDAATDFQPTSDQAIAIGHRYHLAIENVIDEMPRPLALKCRLSPIQWNELKGIIIKRVQAIVDAQNEKESCDELPF